MERRTTATKMHRRPHRRVVFSTKVSLLFVIVVALACFFVAAPVHAAAEPKPSAQKQEREQLTLTPSEATKPWKGDLDGMISRRTIRVLTTYSKTFYFLDKATQRGATYDAFRLFEEDLTRS
jgi:hypothetical protein